MRYVPLTATFSFQPIGSDLPNAVYSFRSIQGSFSCPSVLSGRREAVIRVRSTDSDGPHRNFKEDTENH